MMHLPTSQLEQYYRIATEILTEAETMFSAGMGADPLVMKETGDFATQIDLNIERYLRQSLFEQTNIPVFGEEFGGDQAQSMWVIDPIDGTANYAVGNPMSAILISLIHAGKPVLGITSIPATGQRFAAYTDSPLLACTTATRLFPDRADTSNHIGLSSLIATYDSPMPEILEHGLEPLLKHEHLRVRMIGSVGIDLAYAAAGIYTGAVSFSPHLWDNAAGVVLAQAAGLTVTDLYGNPWQLDARGSIVARPAIHRSIVQALRS